ncbi:hypothetical protein GJAV_G00233940 [Gymnothorax javanicus]|nr:hypothetical protein GJAV_G00233940 [Gymnothorax javanicus]
MRSFGCRHFAIHSQARRMADVMQEPEVNQEETTAPVAEENHAENDVENDAKNEDMSETTNGEKTHSDPEEAPKEKTELKEKTTGGNKRSNRYQPYSRDQRDKKGNKNRVFVSNIPYDTKWQAIKDLMREKVGEVTYVELFKDAEGKSRKTLSPPNP